jgi:hypothetical protein
MKILFVSFALVLAAPAPVALAHPGHDDHDAPAELDEPGAQERARKEIDRLIARKKLDASWKEATHKATEKKPVKKTWEWLVTFENAAATKDKVLYVFLRPTGKFVAANFTGK